MDQMAQADPEVFANGLLDHVLEESPSRLPRPLLLEMVSSGIARARSHGLHSNAQIYSFVSLMFAIAPNFDQHPKFAAVLRDSRLPVDERWERLFEDDLDDAWEEAGEARFYDERQWFPNESGIEA